MIIDTITAIDVWFANFLFAIRDPWTVQLFLWVTQLGTFKIVVTVMLITIVLCWFWQKRSYTLPLLLGVLGSGGMVQVGKAVWQRPRPVEISVYTELFHAFPSGHASIAIMLYGFIIYILFDTLKTRQQKLWLLSLGVILIGVIGFSRLYLGVHFLSDVIGGYIVGGIWLIWAIVLQRYGKTN